MSKFLYLMRHAKAFDAHIGQKDYDRELTPQGIKDSFVIGKVINEATFYPDAIISSRAPRALDTAKCFSEQLDSYDPVGVKVNDEIYGASTRTLLQVVNNLDDKWDTVMIVGHNPSLSYLSEYITKHPIGNIKKAEIVKIAFELDSWSKVSEGNGIFKEYIKSSE